LIVLIMLAAFILFVDHIGLLSGANNHLYDLFFRLRGPAEPIRNVVVIAIDDRTLEKLGRWPIRRLYYALLLNRLREADAVAFDVIMAESSEDDAALQRSVREHGRVTFPILIDDKMAITYPVIASGRDRAGHIHLEQGIDGVVRMVYHTLLYKNTFLSSFSSVIFERVTGTTLKRTVPGRSQGQKTGITQLDGMNINYCGGPGTFERMSLSAVLEGMYSPSFFKNKICLVGATATGVGETFLTPFSGKRKNASGVEVHANILNTLLAGNAIHVAPYWIVWLSALCLVLIAFPCFLLAGEVLTAILVPILLLCIAVITYMLFAMFHFWLPPSVPFFTILSAFFTGYALKFNEAVKMLDGAYTTVKSHLKRRGDLDGRKHTGRGLRGLLTPRGVYSKAEVLGDITDHLIFEKQLADTVIFSDVQPILLFGPDGPYILANNLAVSLFRENGVDIGTADAFMKGIAGFMEGKPDSAVILEGLYAGGSDMAPAFNVALPLPQKRYFKADTSPLTIRGKIYPLFVFSDITAMKELEILKSHVVSLVSHEIRTPLTSIEGFAKMLHDALGGELKRYASVVQQESMRLIRFLNTFLDISRIEEGRQSVRMAPAVLSGIVKEVADELRAAGEENGITLRTETPEQISAAMIDRDLTKQCIINLVENAIKYSPPGKEVIIKLVEENDHVGAKVVDFGIGIREEEMGKIFEKFYRARSRDVRNLGGSGLGLTFVKEAIEAQGGKVSVESRYGEGSMFSVLFLKNK